MTARRINTYIIDLRHYLDDDTGDLADMSGPALNQAMFFSSIVAWATDHEPEDDSPTNVWCWRSPGRKRCRGEIIANFQRGSSEILWQCPLCGVNGVIRGWEDCLWDRRRSPD